MSVAEALIAGAIAALVIGLATTPMLQMKRLENQTDFQSQLEVAHQIALQKARNATFIKRQLGLVPGNEVDSCFGGRAKSAAVDCTTVNPATAQWEKIQFTKSADYKVTSTVDATITCTATKCSQIAIVVSTSQDATTGAQTANTKWKALPLVANFTLPAAALSSRQEIDYSGCVGKIITGINYDTLKAECNAFTGNNTCSTVTSAGPMMTFGQSNNSDPANCQVPQNSSCGDGFGAFGMINGQACAGPVVCTDPFSTACNPPTTTTTLCAKVWTPAPNTKCTGDVFTQTNNCDATTQVGTGTNNSLCPVNPCTSTASVKWPDAALGPCENTTVNISTAANSTAQLLNTKAGYVGSYTVSCTDNTPAPNTYDFANATKTCTPVVCAGLPLTLDWSATGIKSTVAGPGLDAVGPWPCQGLVTITNNPVQTPGTLLTTSADPAAIATANHNPAILTASAGSVSATCTDPGPATAPHAGVLALGAISCTAPVTWNACMNCSDSSPQNAWYKSKGRCGDEEGLDYWKADGPTWQANAEVDFTSICGAKTNQQCFDDLLCGGHTYNMANNTCSKKVGVTTADGACLYGNCSGGCPAPAVTWPACNNKNDTSEQNSWYQSKGRHGETAGLIYWQNAGPNWKADAEISWATNCAGKTDKQCVDSSSCGGHTYDLATDTCKKNSSATSAVGTCFLGNCSSGCPAEPSWPACLDCSDTSPQNDWYKSKGRCGDAAGLAHWKADGPDWQAHAEAARASICGSAPNVICNDNTICGGHIYDFKTNRCYKFQNLSTNVGTVIGGNSLSGSCPVAPVPTYCLSALPSDGRPFSRPLKCMHSGACDPVDFATKPNQTKCEDNGETGTDPVSRSSVYRNSCESVGALTDSTCNRSLQIESCGVHPITGEAVEGKAGDVVACESNSYIAGSLCDASCMTPQIGCDGGQEYNWISGAYRVPGSGYSLGNKPGLAAGTVNYKATGKTCGSLMGAVDKTTCSAEAIDGVNIWYKSGDDQWVYDGVPIGYLANTVRGHSPECDSWKAKATIYTPGVYCADGNVTNYQQTWSNEDGYSITAVHIPVGEVTWTSTETWNCGSESGSRTTCLGTGYIGANITGNYPPVAPYPSEPQCGPSTAPVASTTTTTMPAGTNCRWQDDGAGADTCGVETIPDTSGSCNYEGEVTSSCTNSTRVYYKCVCGGPAPIISPTLNPVPKAEDIGYSDEVAWVEFNSDGTWVAGTMSAIPGSFNSGTWGTNVVGADYEIRFSSLVGTGVMSTTNSASSWVGLDQKRKIQLDLHQAPMGGSGISLATAFTVEIRKKSTGAVVSTTNGATLTVSGFAAP